MLDNRKKDRRKKEIKVKAEHRKGPRRLVCSCGGKIEIIIKNGKGEFFCLRCGKKHGKE